MNRPERIRPDFSWDAIDTVLLDMDGTLLDKHFDDYFWEHYVPEQFALAHGLGPEEARRRLLARYQSVENTLDWADLDYWSEQLGLDIPALKLRIDHLIAVHPYVTDFLAFCRRAGKAVHLVTNAHSKTLAIKLRKTSLGPYFDQIVPAGEIGFAKEEPPFWARLAERLGLDRSRALLADDTEKVLAVAHDHGIACCIHVARPSSRSAPRFSRRFPSIVYFHELLPPGA